jgi:catechol 2,3-dioxygenase-like lactoylglutathione lyase family enzyme
MIDHITVPVSDYERAKRLYGAALAPLGWKVAKEITRERVADLPVPAACGFGPGEQPVLWLREEAGPVTPIHVAIAAAERAQVDAFHAAAVDAGLTDHGAAGPRPQYRPDYYAAFVRDPDGHNLEAVCHRRE